MVICAFQRLMVTIYSFLLRVIKMITYMNRHYCLITWDSGPRIHPGIKLVGVFSQGAERYEAADKAYDWFLRDFQNRDMVLHAKIVHTGNDSYEEGSEIFKQAYEAGRSL